MAAYPQSTAYTRTFNAYLASDHVTAATGLTIVVTLSKAGGAYAAAGGTVTEIANGLYKIALTTTDTNTVGDLAIRGAVATMDDVKFVDQVTDPIRGLGSPTALPGVAAGGNGGLVINGSNTGTVALGGLTTTQLTINSVNMVSQTGDSFARIGAPVGASISADIAAIPAAVWAVVIDGTSTAIKLARGWTAALLGKASGLDTNAPKYRNIADTKDVISATTDASGDRTAVTLDLT